MLLEEVFAVTSAFSWQNSVSFCPASVLYSKAKFACYCRCLLVSISLILKKIEICPGACEFWPRLFHSKNRTPPSQDKAVEVGRLLDHHVYQFAKDSVSEYQSQERFRFFSLASLLL